MFNSMNPYTNPVYMLQGRVIAHFANRTQNVKLKLDRCGKEAETAVPKSISQEENLFYDKSSRITPYNAASEQILQNIVKYNHLVRIQFDIG